MCPSPELHLEDLESGNGHTMLDSFICNGEGTMRSTATCVLPPCEVDQEIYTKTCHHVQWRSPSPCADIDYQVAVAARCMYEPMKSDFFGGKNTFTTNKSPSDADLSAAGCCFKQLSSLITEEGSPVQMKASAGVGTPEAMQDSHRKPLGDSTSQCPEWQPIHDLCRHLQSRAHEKGRVPPRRGAMQMLADMCDGDTSAYHDIARPHSPTDWPIDNEPWIPWGPYPWNPTLRSSRPSGALL